VIEKFSHDFAPGIVLIKGASGCGKSTLLRMLAGYLEPERGEITTPSGLPATCKDYQRRDVGFVFQFYNLIGNLTALENVELANQICKDPLDAAQVLSDVGLGDRMKNFPSQLSGGEQQRVAIARALAKNPKLLLCDEPTGALDYQTGKAILKLLQDTGKRTGMTVIIITHNGALTAMADRVIRVRNGTVVSVTRNENPQNVSELEW
jgi:putative ABC transport system ATP-binding protein